MVAVIRFVLERDGYFVLTAQDGEETLELARKFPSVIHCSLTDIKMPRMDGLTLRDHLTKERPGIKVLLMSAQVHPPDERCFLKKPFDIGVLKGRVCQLLISPEV